MKFSHIAPVNHLIKIAGREFYLVLAHLVEENEEYTEFYRRQKEINPNVEIILDNSGFEKFKRNEPMMDSDKLVRLAEKVKADVIVATDYPGEESAKTVEKTLELAPVFRDAGFKTFGVPQSKIGDLNDYVSGWIEMMRSADVDYIGMSILGAPNAFGVERDNKLQRFMSRWAIASILSLIDLEYTSYHKKKRKEKTELLSFWEFSRVVGKKIHFLGMTDGPAELTLPWGTLGLQIHSWDSSAAVWAGLNEIRFDRTPTGLVDGKFELEVDFDSQLPWTDEAMINIAMLDRAVEVSTMMQEHAIKKKFNIMRGIE